MSGASFRDPTGVLVFILTALALFYRSGLMLLMAAIIWMTRWLANLWGRHSLTRVTYRRWFEVKRVFAGETAPLLVEVVNRKILPLTELAIDDEVPQELDIQGRQTRFLRLGTGVLRHMFSLGWYQRVTRRYTVQTSRRGLFRIGPSTLRASDPFCFHEASETLPEQAELIVYPQIFALEQVGIPSRRPFGDLRSWDRLFEDPSRFAGVRDYQPGDPLNRIHWKASAATGSLQTKLLDPSVNAGLAIFINAWSFERLWEGNEPDSLERGFSVAASILAWAVEQEVACGLYSNGFAAGWGGLLRLPAARGEAVLEQGLEGLARVQPLGTVPLHAVIEDELPSLSYGTSVVLITRSVPEELAATVLRVQRSGRPVTLVLTAPPDDVATPRLPGVTIYRAAGEEALHGALLA